MGDVQMEVRMMDAITVRLCGNPEVKRGMEKLSFPYKKAEGFFYYLCVKKSVTREEVISLLWGDEGESAGKKKLRDAIYQVRQVLGREALLTSGHTGISLNPERKIHIDLDAPESEREEGAVFLDHFFIKNCYEFEEWAESVRASLAEAATLDAQRGLEAAAREHDIAKMQACGNILLKNDPYNENLYYEIMNLYAGNGSYHMAIRLYYDLVKVLKEDVGEEPSARTRELFHRIFNMKERVPSVGNGIAEVDYVGRERELFQVSGILAQENGDRMNFIAVEGEEGVGKSRFLDCCRRISAGTKMISLVAVCYRQGAEFFLSPWNDIFQDVRQLAEEGALSGMIPEGMRNLPGLSGALSADGESGHMRYQLIEQSMLDLFRRISAKHRIPLAFDEIQWMDQVSFQLLVRLVRSISPDRLKVICTYQGSYEAAVMHQLEVLVREDRIRFIALQPFSQEETEKILLRALPEMESRPEERQEIYELTEGNAFFLKEMIAIIREKGFTLEKTPKINLVISSRLSGITDQEREVLGCMAIFPEKISIEELELLLNGVDRLQLIRALDRLQRGNLVQEVLVGWEVYYKFVHRIFQEYIYEHQSAGKTQLYHKMLANYYEQRYGDNFAELPVIAYHYGRAHNEVRAFQYQIRYLQEFYTIINENFPIIHSDVSDLGDSFAVMAEAEKMLGLAKQVIQLQDNSREVNEMKMQMHYIMGRHDIAAGEYDSGIANIERSMVIARRLNARKTLLACYRQHIFHGIQTNAVEKVDQYVSMGLGIIGEEERDEYATFLRLRGWYLIRRQEYAMAKEILGKAISIFRLLSEREGGEEKYKASIAACYSYIGDIYRWQERYEQALQYYNEAVHIGQGPVATNGMAQIYSNIGQVKYLQGRYTESHIYLDKARESLERNGYRWGLERTEVYLALVSLADGHRDAARIHYEKAKIISEKIGNPLTEQLLRETETQLGI